MLARSLSRIALRSSADELLALEPDRPGGRLDQAQHAAAGRGLAAARLSPTSPSVSPAVDVNEMSETACTLATTDRKPLLLRTWNCLVRPVTSSSGALGVGRDAHAVASSTSSSARMHADSALPTGRSSGRSPAQASIAYGHRVRNAQPDGGRSMLGGEPGIGTSRLEP